MEFIKTNWKPILENIIQNNLPNIYSQLEKEREDFDGLCEIYPPKEFIFNAFNFFNFEDLKIVIIGQDPYHQPKQANGLSFSVSDGIKIPPSLKNIFKEIYKENLESLPENGNLEYLAKQGVLLLNNSLTVRQSKPNSHLKYWKGFSDKIVKYINDNSDNKIIFMLWGNNAKKMKKIIDNEKHYILEATHPSPLGANKGGWFGCDHFNKANTYLKDNNRNVIKWII